MNDEHKVQRDDGRGQYHKYGADRYPPLGVMGQTFVAASVAECT